MTDTWKSFVLTENFRPAEDARLQNFLSENAKFGVRISAAKLRRVDTMLVELLLCAATSWRGRGLGFEVTDVSEANEVVFQQLGITSGLLMRRVAA
ncbi:MAG: STAS domain-containing protein [Paracoccaceae bacterium]